MLNPEPFVLLRGITAPNRQSSKALGAYCLVSFFLSPSSVPRGFGGIPHDSRRVVNTSFVWVTCSPFAAGGRWSFQPVRPGATACGLVLWQVMAGWSPWACPRHRVLAQEWEAREETKRLCWKQECGAEKNLEKWPGAGAYAL